MGKIMHEQLSGAIIGVAMEVLNELNLKGTRDAFK